MSQPVKMYFGLEDPEGLVAANAGAIYVCFGGNLYLKAQGSEATGWEPIPLAQAGSASIARRTPAGAIDGVNTTFAFSPAPSGPDAFFLVWNGLVVNPTDYSLAGGVVTTTGFTPKVGDTLYGLF